MNKFDLHSQAARTEFSTSFGRTIHYFFRQGRGEPLVFLNGLSDGLESWFSVLEHLNTERPLVLVDLIGQGQSLRRELDSGENFSYRVKVSDQTACLEELLASLQIEHFSVVGFSYGGGVALELLSRCSRRIGQMILVLPFILRLDLSFPMSRLWLAQYEFFKSMTPKPLREPFDVVERSYDKFIDRYMNYRYLRRIPDDRFRQAAVELSKGIMEFNSFHVLPLLPDERVVLLTAGMDTLVPQSLYQEFWYRIPEAKKQAWVHFTNGEHLILEQAPDAVADYLSRALSHDLVGHHRVALKVTRDRSFQI